MALGEDRLSLPTQAMPIISASGWGMGPLFMDQEPSGREPQGQEAKATSSEEEEPVQERGPEAEEGKAQASQEEEQVPRTTGPTSWQRPSRFWPRPSAAETKVGRWRRATGWASAAPQGRKITWACGRPTVDREWGRHRV